jgi:Leucine-rich repeat (LRR) protein
MAEEEQSEAEKQHKEAAGWLAERLNQPPQLAAAGDGPLEAKEVAADRFDLGYRLGPVYDMLRHSDTNTPLSVAIYGDWGSGKTSAMRWLEARLNDWNVSEKRNHVVHPEIIPVWFYPWKYQEREDVWRGLIAEVIVAALKNVERISSDEAVQKTVESLDFLGGSLKRLIKATKVQIGGGPLKVALDGAKLLEDEIETDKEAEADYLNSYEVALEKWVGNAVGENARMVIFIDDLDRCMPDIALQVLEALKLYLNIPNLIFVIGVDRPIVDQLVESHYRKLGLGKDKSKNYLAKMFQVEVSVAPSEPEVDQFLKVVLNDNEIWGNLSNLEQTVFFSVFYSLAQRSPREVKRLVNSALMAGVGISMSARLQLEGVEATPAQGIQRVLLRRILHDRYQRETMLGSRNGDAFFVEWSKALQGLSEVLGGASLSVEIIRQLKELDKPDATLVSEGGKNPKKSKEVSSVPDHLASLVDDPINADFLPLLGDVDLTHLMWIDFSEQIAEAERASAPIQGEIIVDEAIAREIGKQVDELTMQDREAITRLDLRGTDIVDLAPLQNLNSLESLDLDGTQVSDLAPLQNLNSLESLDLDRAQVSDLAPLQNLNSLRTLFLNETQVSDLAPLQNLNSLHRLFLDGTQVSDLAPLQNLNSLQILYLRNTQVSDLAPLQNLNSLRELHVGGTLVTDLTPLKNFNSLRQLQLSEMQVSAEAVTALLKALPLLEIELWE